jgi:hypothetical protein
MAQSLPADEHRAKQGEQSADRPQPNELNEPVPHVGQALDGRHYLDVLEEQEHADARPDLDGENPRHPEMEKERPRPAQSKQ